MDPQLYPLIGISILALWLVVLTVLYLRLIGHYNAFTKDTPRKDLLSTLNQLLKFARTNEQDIKTVNDHLEAEIAKGKLNFKKFSLKRFNPFTDTGGNQSFVLCLLDENNDGFVISSLHSRENTRLYAKKIVNGLSPDQALSKEESQAIKEAIK